MKNHHKSVSTAWLCISVWYLQALWRNRIIRYFQNSRSRRDNDVRIVIAHQRQPNKQPKAKVFSNSVTLFGIANYLPQRDTGDTDDSINDMMKLMVDEDRRMKPDLGCIDHLMNRTFPDRRKAIVSDGITTSELKTQIPCLFSQDQVKFIIWQAVRLGGRHNMPPPVRAKFEDRSFFRLRNIEGVPKFRNWVTSPGHAQFWANFWSGATTAHGLCACQIWRS